MKQLMPFLILSTVTFFLAVGVILVGMKMAPGMFGGEAGADSTALAGGDSLDIAHADSLADSTQVAEAEIGDDPLALAQAEIARLKSENDSLRTLVDPSHRAGQDSMTEVTVAHTDSVALAGSTIDSKGAAKMIEAMTPESAARVLVQLSADEAKKVIRGVKARQAGKILALLPPDRAAHLMR